MHIDRNQAAREKFLTATVVSKQSPSSVVKAPTSVPKMARFNFLRVFEKAGWFARRLDAVLAFVFFYFWSQYPDETWLGVCGGISVVTAMSGPIEKIVPIFKSIFVKKKG